MSRGLFKTQLHVWNAFIVCININFSPVVLCLAFMELSHLFLALMMRYICSSFVSTSSASTWGNRYTSGTNKHTSQVWGHKTDRRCDVQYLQRSCDVRHVMFISSFAYRKLYHDFINEHGLFAYHISAWIQCKFPDWYCTWITALQIYRIVRQIICIIEGIFAYQSGWT